jgi:predicted transcriptional regulator
LYKEGEQKRTPLATKCHLNYTNCLLYIQWLMFLDLVGWKANADDEDLVCLTEHGMKLGRKLQPILKFAN